MPSARFCGDVLHTRGPLPPSRSVVLGAPWMRHDFQHVSIMSVVSACEGKRFIRSLRVLTFLKVLDIGFKCVLT